MAKEGKIEPVTAHIFEAREGSVELRVRRIFRAVAAKTLNKTVLPAMPLANYLNQSEPVFLVDWAHDAELNFEKNKELVIKNLESNCNYVLIERDKLDQANQEGKYGSHMTKYVLENWVFSRECEYFLLYRR